MELKPDKEAKDTLKNALNQKRTFDESKQSSNVDGVQIDVPSMRGSQARTRMSISLEPKVKAKLKRLAKKNGYTKVSTFLNDLIAKIQE